MASELDTSEQPGANPIAEKPLEARERILEAALKEFAANGLAGARTEKIAAAAGVNKALLYYYFDSKEKLYETALEMISEKIRDQSKSVFLLQATAGERVLRMALNHFDRILAQGEFQSLMQQEMMRLHKGESAALPVLVKRVFAPVQKMYFEMVQEAISSGELINVDWLQITLAAMGANIFYFLSAPVWRLVLPFEPLDPEVLAGRRKALLEYLGQAMFVDRQHGADLAAKVYADTPMPAVDGKRFEMGRKE